MGQQSHQLHSFLLIEIGPHCDYSVVDSLILEVTLLLDHQLEGEHRSRGWGSQSLESGCETDSPDQVGFPVLRMRPRTWGLMEAGISCSFPHRSMKTLEAIPLRAAATCSELF